MPLLQQGSPINDDGTPFPPQAGEELFYVLLEDDKHVTHLEVETDTLLYVDPKEDESFVRLVILVELRPYNVNTFNIAFG